ncbi:MAG: PCYCGC motif-containing (lipo)protein [Candidatus Methylomirabilales bacterium]
MGKAKRVKKKRQRKGWMLVSAAGLLAAGMVAALFFSGDNNSPAGNEQVAYSGDRSETVAAGELPSYAMQASAKVRDAYRYAADHPDVLQYIPCFCGCENVGHRHNGDCYVRERHANGQITFTSHAAT